MARFRRRLYSPQVCLACGWSGPPGAQHSRTVWFVLPQIVHLWTGAPSERFVSKPACANQHVMPLRLVPVSTQEVHGLAHEVQVGEKCRHC